MNQKTIKGEVKYSGIGLHTGNKVEAIIKPAEADNGIRFIRKDLDPAVVIKADIENVDDVHRGTALKSGDVEVFTVEHVLAACAGLGIYNLDIELNSNEFPAGDGSSKPFVELFENIGIKELDKEQEVYVLEDVLEISYKDTFIVMKPCKEFRVSFTIDYDHPVIGSQYMELPITRERFKEDIMYARTFGYYRDYEKLKTQNKAGGSSLENTIGLDDEKVLNEEGLRSPDEFVRHKILDLVGDFFLFGKPLKAHIIAVKGGHALNVAAVKKIQENMNKVRLTDCVYSVEEIKKIIPHRYPFLLVDRILKIEEGKMAIGIKNVTVNEEFFQGHFPVKPVMPGVLIVEALAQLTGVFMLSKEEHKGKLPYFVGIDNVRFRKPVVPGDTLQLEVTVKRMKGPMGKVYGAAKVNDKVVASGDLMFSVVDV